MSYLTQMAGADGAQLRLGRHRHRARHRADPRLRPALGAQHRQLLGRSDPLRALHPAADLDRRRAGVHRARHAAEPQRLYRGDHARRRQADHRPGTGGFAGSHQDAGHQRRRVHERQLGASVREPERADQPDPDPADLLDRRGADQRVRPHGRQPAPGLGDLRHHGRAVPRRRDHLLLGRSRPATRPSPRSTWTRRRARCSPAATWKARRSASASPTRRCSPPSPPMPPAARSTTCTTACCRSPAWCRWSTSCWARSSSAASAPASTACCCSSSSRCSSPG